MSELICKKVNLGEREIPIFFDKHGKVWISERVVCEVFSLNYFSTFQEKLQYAGCFIIREITCKKFLNDDGEKVFYIDLKTFRFACKALGLSKEGIYIASQIDKWLVDNSYEPLFPSPIGDEQSLDFTKFSSSLRLIDNIESFRTLYDQPFNQKLPQIDEYFVFRVIDKLHSELNLDIRRVKREDNSKERICLKAYCKAIEDAYYGADKYGCQPSLEFRLANVLFTLVKSNTFDYCDNAIAVGVVLSIMQYFYSSSFLKCSVDVLLDSEQISIALVLINQATSKSSELLQMVARCLVPMSLRSLGYAMTDKELYDGVKKDTSRSSVVKFTIGYLESRSEAIRISDYFFSYCKTLVGGKCDNFRFNFGASVAKNVLAFDFTLHPFIEREYEHKLSNMIDYIFETVPNFLQDDINSTLSRNIGFNSIKILLIPHLAKPKS